MPLHSFSIVLDTDLLSATATTTMSVLTLPVGNFRCWIDQPRNGNHLWGDFVSLQALTLPAADTTGVTFYYRPAGAGGMVRGQGLV